MGRTPGFSEGFRVTAFPGFRTIRRLTWAAGVIAFPSMLRAVPPELVRAVPSDVSAAYFWQGPQPGEGTDRGQGTAEFAALLIDGAVRVGALSMVDPALRPWIDGTAASTVAARYPFSLVLFDVYTSRDDDSQKVDDIRAALVILTNKDNGAIERRLRHLLASYTNQEETTLETRDDDGRTRFVLRDRRLPGWALWEWGVVDDFYVVTVGDGSFDRVVDVLVRRRESLAEVPWFERAGDDLSLGRSASVLYLQPGALVRNADEDMTRKLRNVLAVLHLSETQRILIALRRDGRVVTIEAVSERAGRHERHTIAGGAIMNQERESAIPEQATRCTVIPWNPKAMLSGLQNAVLAARSPRHREEIRAFWREVEEDSGVSFERDLAARLGDRLIIHNHPPHALNLPLAWTYVLPIQEGQAPALRERLDVLLDYTRTRIGPDAMLQLRRDPHGVWYLHAGLDGPALTVTDHAVVVSFSPTALHAVVPHATSNNTTAAP